MWKFWIQNHFCAILGDWDICKTKLGSEIAKFIFILTWSVPHSTRMALRCPISTLTDLIMSWEALRGPELPKLVSQGWPGPDRGQLVHLGANLSLLRPLKIIPDMTLSISESYFVLQISQSPNIAQKWFYIQNLHMDLSFQKKKIGLEICLLVLEILNKQTL